MGENLKYGSIVPSTSIDHKSKINQFIPVSLKELGKFLEWFNQKSKGSQ